MPLPFYVHYQGTLTNAGGDADLLEIQPASNKPVKLVRLILGQFSEVGDTAEEIVRISIMRLPATVTSGNGSAVTKTYPSSASGAASATVEANGATVATTSGTAETLGEFSWNLRNTPCEIPFYDDNFRPRVVNGEALVVRCQSTVADDVSITVYAELLEE